MICSDCGTTGIPKSDMKGSIILELFLWLMMILPGLLYSIWRLSTKGKVCRSCGSKNIIPIDTPRGRALLQQFRSSQGLPVDSAAASR
ncbi:MAG: hypothetical protein LAN84_00295 [Acidobacteriia bacterium]|nr:hypothetical protein [Terriglobia bacterium]